ncbi:hypothetical protein CKF94_04370 [Vibrio coralliilyticus]|uniref:YopT-type cysteine protease domain-containing protein n=1 Tax=Vibrio coralliilyticus TaxID=190893 RepID=UPI000BAAC589|nr:YopT-type cysteine protease domain-containing protein [Vibrio coralliilyticus]PAU40311.1 hypothetical protein CKF94_04370 [Vibrio coralliilyticus]
MKDKIVANFSQVDVMKAKKGTSAAATNGACHNFSIEWLSFMFEKKGDAKQRMKRLSARDGAGNPVLQKTFASRWSEGGASYQVADRMMISLRGLKETALLYDYTHFNIKNIVKAVTKPQHAGFIYSFWFPGAVVGASGAHTIAFYRSLSPKQGSLKTDNDTVYIFEPNYGEFEVPSKDFESWLKKLATFYAPFNAHMVKTVAKA